jgi:hypothetical protein
LERGQDILISVVFLCLLVVSSESDLASCFRRHLLAANKNTDWFQWEHARRGRPLRTIHRNPLLGSVVTYTVQLSFPAKLGNGFVVILVSLNMQVMRREQQISTMDQDSL